ncbi:MAG: hypothetical protein WB682_15325 [Candidatus Dormiibacterota bacterium]
MKTVPRERKPRKNRALRFLVLTLGSGALAALLAIVIAGIPTVLGLAFPTGPTPEIQASAIFPPVQPVRKVIDVYDPPKQAPRPRPQPPAEEQRPVGPSANPEPTEPGDD